MRNLAVRRNRAAALALLQASCWLAIVLVLAKAATWDKPFPHLGERLLALLMSSWTDVLFAFGCGLVGATALTIFAKWPRVVAGLRGIFFFLFTICAAYAVVAIGLFRYFNRPISFALLGLIGNAVVIRSSIVERVTLPIALALLVVPLAFLALALWSGRSRGVTAGLCGIAALWIIAGWWLHRTQWKEEQLTHLWLSPHYELLRTTALRLTGGQRPVFPKDFPPEDVAEFRTFAGRGGAATSHFQPPPGVPRPKNTIIVVLESVGTKYLSLYGSPLEVTPNLSAAAQNALVFDNIYAHASFTYCSFRTLAFSVYAGLPWHYAMLGDARALPGTLAGALRARGSRTAFINNGNLDWEDQRWLLESSKAFETMDDYASVGCPPLSSWGTEDRCLFDRLIRWIDEKPGEPFFAICWTDQTHDPYPLAPDTAAVDFFAGQTAPPFATDLSRYLNVIHETDRHLGRMFVALRERGLAEETLVVVTGDHGEAFADPHNQRGHSWSVFEEEVHVPLFLWNPRLFPVGQRAATIGGHVDLNATIADILEVEPSPEWQGHSLFDPAKPNRAFFMAIAGGNVFGLREGDWKYMYDVTSAGESLFNLRADPEEQHDVVASEPARAERLRQRVAAWVTFEDAFLWGREN